MKFKIGDKVRIVGGHGSIENAINQIGTITRISYTDGHYQGDIKVKRKEYFFWTSTDILKKVPQSTIKVFKKPKKEIEEQLVADEDGFKREDKSNKVDFTLIPIDVLEQLAIHYTEGAKRHGEDNWKKSKDMTSFKKACFRHLIAILNNKDDEDHYSALIWNTMALKWNKLNDVHGKEKQTTK